MFADPLHLSQHQRTPSTPPLSSSCSSRRSARFKTSNPCNHRNQQYSIIGLTNAAGTLVERYSYTAYGTLGIYDPSGTVRTASTYANRYTYTGREYDPDLNHYHFRARWYDPATGSFISRDPLGYVDGMSLYRGYFGVKGTDPTGSTLFVPDVDDELIAQGPVEGDSNTRRRVYRDKDGNCYQIIARMLRSRVPCPDEEVRLFVEPLTPIRDKDGKLIKYDSDPTTVAETAWNEFHTLRKWTDRILYGENNGTLQWNLEKCQYKGQCIKEIQYVGHGAPGFGMGVYSRQVKDLFVDVLFCADCEIWINTCNSGVATQNGIAFAAAVAKITGCKTYGTLGYCSGFGTFMKIWEKYSRTGGVAGQGRSLHRGSDNYGKGCYETFEPPCVK